MPIANQYLNQDHKDYLSIIAYVYLKNNQLEKAITVYKTLWNLFPDAECFAFCLGYLYFHTSQFETALFYADHYLSKKNTGIGYLLKSQTLLKLGRNHDAKETMRHFLT